MTKRKRIFWEVRINGRTYARFDQRDHARFFALQYEKQMGCEGIAVVEIERARL